MPLTPLEIHLAQSSAEVFKTALADGLQPGPASMVSVAFEVRRLSHTLERLVVIAERLADPAQAVSFLRQVSMIADNLKEADATHARKDTVEEFARKFTSPLGEAHDDGLIDALEARR